MFTKRFTLHLLPAFCFILTACGDASGPIAESTTTSTTTEGPSDTFEESSSNTSSTISSTGQEPTQNCGDGIVDADEKCDNGIENSNDYSASPNCATSCKEYAPHCGDGLCSADDRTNGCLPDCGDELQCGDGYVDPGEACEAEDDTPECNGKNAGDSACQARVCGDGYTNTNSMDPEACDDGNSNVHDGCVSCEKARCGDGVLWTEQLSQGVLPEQCDDANSPHLCDPVDCQEIRTVFVSSTSYNGNLGGIEGADGKCDTLALNAGLKGRFRAWLSNGVNGPSTRFVSAYSGRYILPDGTVLVENGFLGLTSMDLQAAINQNENGQPLVAFAWTNTLKNGEPMSSEEHCSNWSSNSFANVASAGDTSKVDANWTNYLPGQTCDSEFSLYCFQDQ